MRVIRCTPTHPLHYSANYKIQEALGKKKKRKVDYFVFLQLKSAEK